MEGQTTLTAVEIFVGLVAAAGLIGLLARRIAVPYTVALVVFGLAAAIVPSMDKNIQPRTHRGRIGRSVAHCSSICACSESCSGTRASVWWEPASR